MTSSGGMVVSSPPAPASGYHVVQLLQIYEAKASLELKVERANVCLPKQICNYFSVSKFKQEKKGIISCECV